MGVRRGVGLHPVGKVEQCQLDVYKRQGKFILNLLPSGILHPEVTCVLGTGMVIDLEHLAGEMEAIEARGVKVEPENLKLSDKATISMPWHKVCLLYTSRCV